MSVASFVVKVFLHTKNGTERVSTIPCVSYHDAEIFAGTINGNGTGNRSAEIGIMVPLPRGNSSYIPCAPAFLDAVRIACDEAMDAMTRPEPKMPKAPTFFKEEKDEIPY